MANQESRHAVGEYFVYYHTLENTIGRRELKMGLIDENEGGS